jgi:hypothetical protein
MEPLKIRMPFIREITAAVAALPVFPKIPPSGGAYLYKRRSKGKVVYKFMLVACNGEKLIGDSQPYNRKVSMLNTLRKYFGNFVLIDKTAQK